MDAVLPPIILVQIVCASQLGLHGTRTIFGLGLCIPRFSSACIAIRATAKTVKSKIHFHAGIAICMEWTANHAAAVWTKTIGFCGLPGGDIQLYDFE